MFLIDIFTLQYEEQSFKLFDLSGLIRESLVFPELKSISDTIKKGL